MAIIIKSDEINERRIREFVNQSQKTRKDRKLQLICNGQVTGSASLTDHYIEVSEHVEATDQQ